MKLTRRQLVVAAAAGPAVAARALAQSGTAAPAGTLSSGSGATTATDGTAPTAADFAKQARDNVQQNADTLAKLAIPMSTEPAFQFKA